MTYLLLAGIALLFGSQWLPATFAPRGGGSEKAMRIVLSVALLGAGLFVILAGHLGFAEFDASDKNWASGALGAVVAYWLKS